MLDLEYVQLNVPKVLALFNKVSYQARARCQGGKLILPFSCSRNGAERRMSSPSRALTLGGSPKSAAPSPIPLSIDTRRLKGIPYVCQCHEVCSFS